MVREVIQNFEKVNSIKGELFLRGDKSISHDFVTGNYIKTTELGRIFGEAGRVDLYVSMACFMQMAEVAYEIRDYAGLIVGSEEEMFADGNDYRKVVEYLTANPSAPPKSRP